MRAWLVAVALGLSASIAPRAAADEPEQEARALFQAGNSLLEQGQYVAALEKFRAAHARLPSVKILLNIGTTLRLLGRNAEAADAYEAYLADPSADANRRAEVEGIVAQLDASVGKLDLRVADAGGRVLVDGKVVGEGVLEARIRVEPGTHTLVGEWAGLSPTAITIAVAAGEQREVRMARPAAPDPAGARHAPPVAPVSVRSGAAADRTAPPRAESLSHTGRVGAIARVDVDGRGRGAVVAPGLTAGIFEPLEIEAAALLGRDVGLEIGATVFLLRGTWKPRVSLAAPIFFVSGPRPGVRLAGGLQWDASAHFGFFIEAGASYFPAPPDGYDQVVFVPSAGVQARL